MTRRLVVLLAAVGLILLAAALRELSVRWRRRPPRPLETPRYSGVAASADYSSALALGALASVRAGEVLDAVPCRRPRRAIKRELRTAAEPYRRSVLGEEDVSTAIGRCVNDLLGPAAETVGGHLARAEELLRHRHRGGPELWHHAIDEWAARATLPPAAVASLHDTADEIAHAEDQLRRAGILGAGEVVPSLLAFPWGQGVHLARGAIRVGWLDRTRGLNYLRRAGELARLWYPTPRTLLAAQLLPAYLTADAETIGWAERVVPALLADPRSPLAGPDRTPRRSGRP